MITGAAAGIGKACSQLFAAQGANLILIDNREAELKSICSEVKSRTGVGVFGDNRFNLTKTEEIEKAFLEIAEHDGSFHILVNNAGGGLPTDFFKITPDEWNSVLTLNLTSAFLISQRAALHFKKRGEGVIVNLSL